MLQQTQVETALPYYERFLKRFPSIKTLAGASEVDVLRLWSGLGYYNRARNLLAAAGQVISAHGGQLPRDYDLLIQLPGVGRYMAGAIMSIAFNEPYPIVDGNVRRVLSRLHGWTDAKDSTVWDAARDMVDSGEPRAVNQAMMELGATICTSKAPHCDTCPLRLSCEAYRTGRQTEIPAPRKRQKTVRVDLFAVIDRNRNGILMREEKGLWEFPLLTEPPNETFRNLGRCRHSITHHRLEVVVYEGKMPRRNGYRRIKFEDVPITSLTRKIYALAIRD
jgi:A/G-specific adenine glycosylase